MTMRRWLPILAVLMLVATAVDAGNRVCAIRAGVAHPCNGSATVETFTLAQMFPLAVFPVQVIEAATTTHFGTSFRDGQATPTGIRDLRQATPLGGFYTVVASTVNGNVMLIKGLHRDLGGHWVYRTPSLVDAADTVVANWGCQAYQWNADSQTWDALTIQTDLTVCIEQ